jgi:glycosyltransferase involved in cell wall biosynthesis
LLLSGSIWTKNSYRAIKAFDKIISDNKECRDYKMIITGLKRISFKVRNTENFVFTDYLNRGTLEKLFKNSLALVYPTLNEGFGYPPLEAMKYGVSVYASEIPSVREVCGDAAIYFDPTDIKDIQNKLLSAIYSDDLFSKTNIQKRCNRYNMIKKRQEDDLLKLIMLLQGKEMDSKQEVISNA